MAEVLLLQPFSPIINVGEKISRNITLEYYILSFHKILLHFVL